MATRIWTGAADDGDYANTANWADGTVPIAGDDVWFNSGDKSVTTNLNQSAVVLDSFNVTMNYTGLFGTESDFLQVAAPLVNIGGDVGAGSQRINLDLGSSTAATVNITDSNGTSADTDRAPIRLVYDNAATNVYINGASSNVALFDEPDDTGASGSINILSGSLEIGPNITSYTALNISGSGTTVDLLEPDTAATITIDDGTVTISGTNAIAQVDQRGGTVNSNTTGTITAYNLLGGVLDLQQSEQPRTITTLTQSPINTTLRHLEGVVTLTTYVRDTTYKFYTISYTET